MEGQTNAKIRIKLPTDAMTRVKSVSGGVSFHCGDEVAKRLQGLPLEQVKAIAATVGIDASKYGHLNQGQQRMNIGNLLRSFVRKNPDQVETFNDAADGIRAAYEAETAEARAEAERVAAEKEAAKKAAKEAAEQRKAERAAKREQREAEKKARDEAREAKKAERERIAAEKKAAKEAKKAADANKAADAE